MIDIMTGLGLAYATVSAILNARATGKGRDADVSLFDIALTNLGYLSAWYLNTGHNQGREPRSGHPSLTPCAMYRTKDGWIFIMCNKEKFWGVLKIQPSRSEEHTSALQSLMRISYAVFCLNKKKNNISNSF